MEGRTTVIYKQNLDGSLEEINSVENINQVDGTLGEYNTGFNSDLNVELSNPNSDCDSDNFTVFNCDNELNGECFGKLNPLDPRPVKKDTEPKSERKCCYSLSKKDVYKKARNSGKSYIKLKGRIGTFVGEKEIGPDCLCPNKCFDRIGHETVQKIFRDFWALADYNSQNAYLFGLINLFNVKRRYTKNEESRRNFTIAYSIKKKGENVSVCKKAFLNIHGLQRNRGRINNLANKMKTGESVPPPDQRGRHSNRPNAYSEEAIRHVKRHLFQCPKLDGGNNRNPSKPSKLMEYSTKRCYDLYVAVYCKKHNLLPVSQDKFRRIFWEEGYRNSQSSEKRTNPNLLPSNQTIRKLCS